MWVPLIVMLFTFTVCSSGENVSTPATSKVSTTSASNITKNIDSNITLISEGGSQIAHNEPLNLFTVNETNYSTGDSSKNKKISPRKGAPNITSSEEQEILQDTKLQPTHDKNKLVFDGNTAKNITSNINSTQIKETNLNNTTTPVDTVNKTVSVHVKKPLVLEYDALENDRIKETRKLPISKSSSETLVADQIPAPSNTPNIHVGNAGKNPEIIVPIVITILVVPVFAILGYMAVKRGQEAWKNRHYKRMDFLLDGMYND